MEGFISHFLSLGGRPCRLGAAETTRATAHGILMALGLLHCMVVPGDQWAGGSKSPRAARLLFVSDIRTYIDLHFEERSTNTKYQQLIIENIADNNVCL